MGTRNLHFLNQNSQRLYPLSDAASGVSTAGAFLPTNILVDLNLRYPESLGYFPYLSSVAVTPGLVSFTVQVASSFTDTASFAPLAAFSMELSEVEPGVNYAILPQAPGVGGWVVFGEGIREAFTGRFAGPQAGLLAPRAAKPYHPLPVTSMAILGDSVGLTDIIKLSSDQPLTVTRQEMEIDGILRDVAVIGLAQTAPSAGLNITETSVFETFAGPCGNRPESGNCTKQPIEYLNAIEPDCDGNITVIFTGAVIMGVVDDGSGIILDSALGLMDTCVSPVAQLPAADGSLPIDYPDKCSQTVSTESETLEVLPVSESFGNYESEGISESFHSLPADLPNSETFNDGSAGRFRFVCGGWTTVADDSPADMGGHGRALSTETNRGQAELNLCLYEGTDIHTVPRLVITDLKFIYSAFGNNGGIVLNWRPDGNFTGRYNYFAAQLDYDTQTFGIYFFNGTRLVPTSAFAQLTNIECDKWYRLAITTSFGDGNSVVILAVLIDVVAMTTVAFVELTTNNYLPDVGWNGLTSNRSRTRFSYYRVSDAG